MQLALHTRQTMFLHVLIALFAYTAADSCSSHTEGSIQSANVPCMDVYEDPLRTRVFQAEDVHEEHPLPGHISHVTLAGAAHHGLKGVEVWMQKVPPYGFGTPIHSHNGEKVMLVISGEGSLLSWRDGNVVEQALKFNSTAVILPGVVHQVKSKGEDALTYIAALSVPVGLTVFPDWESISEGGMAVEPSTFDIPCPVQFPKGMANGDAGQQYHSERLTE